MTPPNVLGAAKPAPSIMVNNGLAVPFGGTMLGGHQGVESAMRKPGVGQDPPPIDDRA